MKADAIVEMVEESRQRPHFVVLNGLRGVAALCVVIFHFTESHCNSSGFGICHGFLAVDFFFCLSGFVLGYAYDGRVAAMGLGRFLKMRLMRLHPMVVFGAVLGFITFLMISFRITPGYGPGKVALALIASILLVPSSAIQGRGGDLFSLNPSSWSLFWEYAANLIFGLAFQRIGRPSLVVLTVVPAIVLCMAGHQEGNLSGGWNANNWSVGAARVMFSFSAGLLVYRSGWCLRSPIGFAGLSMLLILAFMLPYASGAWVREAAVIMVYFPLLIVLGAGAVVSPRMERICRFSGELSYPLYMTHYAVVLLWGTFVSRQKLALPYLWLSVIVGVLGTVALSWMALKFFDQPVRAYLRERYTLI